MGAAGERAGVAAGVEAETPGDGRVTGATPTGVRAAQAGERAGVAAAGAERRRSGGAGRASFRARFPRTARSRPTWAGRRSSRAS